MQTNRSRWVWFRVGLAALVTFFVIACFLPDVGHIVVDTMTIPPTSHVVRSARDLLIPVGIAMMPLLLIVVGALWVALLESIGWALLVVGVGMMFFGR